MVGSDLVRHLANIIHEAWRVSIQKLLFLGSSCIYPKLAPQPMQESALLTGPLEPTNELYAMDKLLIDKAMKMLPIPRVALAELLLASINYEEGYIREAWISEVNERMKAVNEGRSSLLDFDAFYREA